MMPSIFYAPFTQGTLKLSISVPMLYTVPVLCVVAAVSKASDGI